jgi:predicted MFS family arabinose efflux permease
VDAITSAFFGIVAWRCLPRGNRTEAHLAGWGVAWKSIRVNRAFLALFAACICGSWSFRQTATTFMLHLERSGHSMSWSGIILAINGIMIVTLEIALTVTTRRLSAPVMLAIGYTMMGGAFLVLLGACPLWIFVLSIVIFTVGEMFAFSRQQAYAASLAPDEMRGRYSGFLSFAWAIGGIGSSVLGLRVYDASPASVWITSAVLGVIAAIFVLGIRERAE